MKQYTVDAFTDKIFAGNPAAVCVMDEWISYGLMQKIAIENNLSETAFAVREGENYRLRWFTPGGEVELYCRDKGGRTEISGKAALFAQSEIYF